MAKCIETLETGLKLKERELIAASWRRPRRWLLAVRMLSCIRAELADYRRLSLQLCIVRSIQRGLEGPVAVACLERDFRNRIRMLHCYARRQTARWLRRELNHSYRG